MGVSVPQYDIGLNFKPGPGLFDGASPEWQLAAQKVAQGDMFRHGLPTVDGTPSGAPDLGAMAKIAFQNGALEQGGGLLSAALAQKQMDAASKAMDGMSAWSSPSNGAGKPAASSSYVKPAPGFDSNVNRTLGFEGGLNPADTNGTTTNFGINQAAHPNIDVAKLTQDQAKGIYKTDYWDSIDGDKLAAPMQRAAFDTAVIAGPEKAKEFLAASGGDPQKFMDLRERFQNGLIQSDPAKYGPYAKAWAARNNGLRYDIAALSAAGVAPDGTNAPAAPTANADAALASQPPVQVAQNGATDAPSGVHPYVAAGATPVEPGARATNLVGPDIGADNSSSAPLPTSFSAPPPPSPQAGALTNPSDPTFGGQVPQAWLAAGHNAADWVRYQRAMAGLAGTNPYMKAAGEQWAKSAEDLQTSMNKQAELTNEQKNASDPKVLAYETNKDIARAKARADAALDTALTPVTQSDGTVTMMPKRVAMAQAAAGNGPVQSLPGYVTSGQQNLLTKLNDGSAAYTERQVASERLDALSDLLSTFQTGANTTAFADAKARLASIGIPIPASAMKDVASVQEFTKDAYANVLSSMKEQGNKQFVAEVQSAVNSNPNVELQPAANASMIARMKAIKAYHDANFEAFTDWYNTNKGASNDAQFQLGWAKKNPLSSYVARAAKDIAPMGVPLPDKAQLVDGQAYMVKGQKMVWDAGANGFLPYGARPNK